MTTIITALTWARDQYAKALITAYSDVSDDQFRARRDDEKLRQAHERMALALVYF